MINICRICDSEFNAQRLNQTLCSDECRKKHRHMLYKNNYKGSYTKVKPTKKVCIICESDFETTNNMQKCCTPKCSNIHRVNSSRKLQQMQNYKSQSNKVAKDPNKSIDKYFLVRGEISNHRRSSAMGEA